MKKAVSSGLLLLSISAMLLSSCGTRHCLQTTMGCEPDRSEERETVPGVWRADNRMSCDGARSVSRQLSHRSQVAARGEKVGRCICK